MENKYFISFIEEAIMNQNYESWVGGRIEIFDDTSPYAIEEIRFFTDNVKAFEGLRESWEFKSVSKKLLDELRTIINRYYYKK